jgi:hypothetical protein
MSKIKSVIEGFDCRLQVAKITSGKLKCQYIGNKTNITIQILNNMTKESQPKRLGFFLLHAKQN